MFETILVEKNNAVAKLTLNRPERLNSFNVQMHQELQNALDDIATDRETRCLLITGAGRGFCAGQDLNDRAVNSDAGGDGQAAAPDLGKSVEQFYNPLIRRISNLHMPVICALNGVAAGAGASLVMACDIVIAARSASFVLSFAKVGLVPDSGSSWHLARAIGMPRAKALALLGHKLKAEQAEQWGLIYQVVDDDQLAAASTKLTEHLATQPTDGLARTKKLIHSSFETSLNQQLEKERLDMQYLGRSHDYQEGVAAFIEKRHPKFNGR